MQKMVGISALDVVQAYMGHVQDNAEESVRRAHRQACTIANFPIRWIRAA